MERWPGMAVALGLLAAALAAGAASRHAGSVAAVDAADRRLAIEEMAPGARVTRIEARVPEGTTIVLIAREQAQVVFDKGPEGREIVTTYRYVERPLPLAEVRPGDFVVLELEDGEAGTPVARRVEITARALPR